MDGEKEVVRQFGASMGRLYLGMLDAGVEPHHAQTTVALFAYMSATTARTSELDAMLKKIIKQEPT